MLTTTPMVTKDSDKVCAKTIYNRNRYLMNMVQSTSGKSTAAVTKQAGKFVKTLGLEQREEILKQANIPSVEISEENLVAMKVDMGIPWEKLKTMSRFFSLHHILHLNKLCKTKSDSDRKVL